MSTGYTIRPGPHNKATQGTTGVPTTGVAHDPRIAPDVYTRYEQITPARAEELLQHNKDNRHISDSVVDAYVELIKQGQWVLTHQGIALGKDGMLYDGQHRLWAVFKSGHTVPFQVTYNLPPESRAWFDAGRKRSVADNYRILTGDKEIPHYRVVETANVVHGLIHNLTSFQSNIGIVKELMDPEGTFREGILWASGLTRKNKRMAAPVRGALALAYRDNPEKVAEFTDKLVTGLNIDAATNPVKVLSNYLDTTKVQGNGPARRVLAVKTLRALYAYLYEGKLSRLFETEDAVVFFARAHGLKLQKHTTKDSFRAFASASGKYTK
jgi:hypothetical protein